MSKKKPKNPNNNQGIQKSFDYEDIVREVAKAQMLTQHIPAMVAEEIKKGWKQLPNTDPSRSPKSWFVDPLGLQYSLGYKDRKFSLTYDTLKRTVDQLSILSAVINTRCAQIAAFSEPYRKNRSLGFAIKHKDPDHPTTSAEVAFIKELENFISNCGRTEPNPYSTVKRDNFDTFIRKIVRDSLTMDQCCAEIIRDRIGIPYEFIAVDASTIRYASDARYTGVNSSYHQRDGFVPGTPSRWNGLYEGREYGNRTADGDPIEYVQVINGQIENIYSGKELAFGVRNPQTNIYLQGYGKCIHPNSRVATTKGLIPVKELINSDFEIMLDGKSHKATAFKTDKKQVYTICFETNHEINVSADHKFYVLNPDGEFEWKIAADIIPNDTVAFDTTINEWHSPLPDFNYEPGLQGKNERCDAWSIKDPDADLWEVLGWLVGDGSVNKKSDCSSYSINWFYERDTETEILKKHIQILKKYNLEPAVYDYPTRGIIELKFSHKALGIWLSTIVGYKISNEIIGKPQCLPESVFRISIEKRCAFLRGLFSADGCSSNDTVTLGCTDEGLLRDTQKLLLTLGIRSRFRHFKTFRDVGCGAKNYDAATFYVYDKVPFTNLIGFLQEHKQSIVNPKLYQGTRIDNVGESFGRRAASSLRKHYNWKDMIYRRCTGLIQNPARWGVTRSWLKNKFEEINDNKEIEKLKWHHATVKEVKKTNEEIEMCDISVFNEFHGFSLEGAVAHNSEVEQLITIITSHLNAEAYNRYFFSQGSSPKGLLNFKGDNWTPEGLEAFKRQWHAQVSGVENSWKTPILQSEGLEWVDLNKSNQEMEFGKWLDYCLKVICGVFLIDPAEINFQMQGGVSQTPLFESSSEWKLKASKDKGLKPLLKFIASMINKHIIDQIDDHFTFEFVGLDELSEQEKHEMLIEKLSSYCTLNESRKSLDLPELPYGDVPMNPVYLQAMQIQNEMKMQEQQMAMQQAQPQVDPNVQQSSQQQLPGSDPNATPEAPNYAGNFGRGQA